MPGPEPEVVEFDVADTHPLVGQMETLCRLKAGWINLEPEVIAPDEPEPPRSPLSIFSRPAPRIPLATWTPGPPGRKGDARPATVGIQHPTGHQARLQLRDAGHPVPRGWAVLQDHTRRGLVVAVPAGVPHDEVAAWLLRAGAHLCPLPVTGRWRAAVYSG